VKAPLLTVLMPVYNGATYVADAISSVLGQTFTDFELLLIDDGSTDESLDVIRGFRDPRIRVERQLHNRGLIETLNSGLQLARGALLARMDADDLSHPQRFAVQVDYLRAHSDVAGVSCAFDMIDACGVPLANDLGRFRPTEPLALRWALHFGCFFTHSGAMLRTSVVRGVGGFDKRYIHAEDYDLWLRLAGEHRLANVAQILLTRREHGGNVSFRFHEVQRQSAHRALSDSLERLLGRPIPPELAKHVYEGTLPGSASDTLAVASLHGEVFRALSHAAAPEQARAMADDLAERLALLTARALVAQPWSAPMLAVRGARIGFVRFVRALVASLRGDRRVYRRSPVFVSAPAT
jgi:glycosyltransferase involved in cell wall biosynthesis